MAGTTMNTVTESRWGAMPLSVPQRISLPALGRLGRGRPASFGRAFGRAFAASRVLTLHTSDPATGRLRESTVWAVMVDGRVYIRSRRGAWRGWYRDLRAGGFAAAFADGRCVGVELQRVDDPAVIDAVTRAFAAKYRGEPELWRMLHADALGATFEVRPGGTDRVGRILVRPEEMYRWKLAALLSASPLV